MSKHQNDPVAQDAAVLLRAAGLTPEVVAGVLYKAVAGVPEIGLAPLGLEESG